jgi:putative tryptophan/tyrosine transport system substrate-binding protein
VYLDFPDFAAKIVQLLVESAPGMQRIGVLWDPTIGPQQNESVRRTAAALKLQTEVIEVRAREDLEPAIVQLSRNRAEALVILSSPVIPVNGKMLADLALRHRLPAITPYPDFARIGGLFAYGPNLLGMFRQSGTLAGKVLRGRDPADLPIERPSKFEFIVNVRTAEALGITVSPPIFARADEVIE